MDADVVDARRADVKAHGSGERLEGAPAEATASATALGKAPVLGSAAGRGGTLAQLLRVRGWIFHRVTGHLVVRLAGVALADAAVVGELIPALAALVAEERFAAGGGAGDSASAVLVRKARVDLSGTALTDDGLRALLENWPSLGLGACSLCLMLHRNRLTDGALLALGEFAASDVVGTVEELHISHQVGPSPIGRGAVLALLERFARSPKYPIWAKRARAFRPVHLRLNNCGVASPADVAGELEAATGARVCFADDQGCVRTACRFAREAGRGCPVAHLYEFRKQERPEDCFEPKSAADMLAAGSVEEGTRQKGKAFLCGSCGRELPIDMFTRSQFQKATKMDREEAAKGDEEKAHLVRRCNDCVKQPCCACHEELPLSAFAGTQMLRPHGSRRCRMCAAETWVCVRCRKPKAKSAFSSVEARKIKKVAKICIECEQSNPYFERRHAICMAFSGRYARPPARLPALAREVLLRIFDFAREARFVCVSREGFRCALCSKSWSFLWFGDDGPIERHLRTSQVHRRRLRSVENGNLVEIASTGLEVERFHEGLGIRGAFCGREQVDAARRLVHAMVPGCGGRPRWVSPEDLPPAAPDGSAGERTPEAGAETGEASSESAAHLEAADRAPAVAAEAPADRGALRRFYKLRKLSVASRASSWGDGGADNDYAVDENELAEVHRFLSAG